MSPATHPTPTSRRALRGIVVVAIVTVLVLALVKNTLIRSLVAGGVKAATGLDVRIHRLHVGIFNAAIGVSGVEIRNPPGFPDRTMVDMPELYLDCDLRALLRGQVRLQRVRLAIRELLVERNDEGRLNLDALRSVQASQGTRQVNVATPNPAPSLPMDVLELELGHVLYKDYSKGSPPFTQTYELNIHERYEQVTSPEALASIVLVKALSNTMLARVTKLNLGSLRAQAGETLARASVIASDVIGTATQTSKHLGALATNGAKKTSNLLKKVLPFGQ